MIRSLLFLVFCIGFIQANIFRDLFSSESLDASGVSFSLMAADPTKYNHATGGGSYAEGVSSLDGFYFTCGERASLVLLVTTDSTFTCTSSSVLTLDFSAHPR